MTESQLPPGLVLWPGTEGIHQRIGVLISDIHCTDCTVGNQTADETDWKNFFSELEVKLDASITDASEVVLILNGDVVDLLRSGKWAAAQCLPVAAGQSGFQEDRAGHHARHCRKACQRPGENKRFIRLLPLSAENGGKAETEDPSRYGHSHRRQPRQGVAGRSRGAGDLLPAMPRDLDCRRLECRLPPVGGRADGQRSRRSLAAAAILFCRPALRLFATHGQWRDNTNSRSTSRWKFRHGWQPQVWQQEQYRAFSDPCFGDTIASGLLSGFIWNTTQAIERDVIPFAINRSGNDGIEHILNVLREMDLYRPASSAVVRLLEEIRKLDRKDEIPRGSTRR